MSQKVLLATAAALLLFSTQSNAASFQTHNIYKDIASTSKYQMNEEDEWNGEIYGHIGRNGRGKRPNWQIGGKITFDEEQDQEQLIPHLQPTKPIKEDRFDYNEWEECDKSENMFTKDCLNYHIQLHNSKHTRQPFVVNCRVTPTHPRCNQAIALPLDEEEWNGEVYGEYGRENSKNWKVGEIIQNHIRPKAGLKFTDDIEYYPSHWKLEPTSSPISFEEVEKFSIENNNHIRSKWIDGQGNTHPRYDRDTWCKKYPHFCSDSKPESDYYQHHIITRTNINDVITNKSRVLQQLKENVHKQSSHF